MFTYNCINLLTDPWVNRYVMLFELEKDATFCHVQKRGTIK